jgi:sugar lactone lactonase YvrE
MVDGTGGSHGTAELYAPSGVAVDTSGNVYVADSRNNCVRKIDPFGATTTLSGNGQSGLTDGTGGRLGTARYYVPTGVAVDADGLVYVADMEGEKIRKLDASGNSTTLAGNMTPGFVDGTGGLAGTAEFAFPSGIATRGAGVYVADQDNNSIREVDKSSGVTTTVAGNGTPGFVDGTGGRSGTAEFQSPMSIAVDAAGNIYVADYNNHRIRKIDPSGNATTLAGNGMPGFADGTGGATGTARFHHPSGVAVDAAGNVYVADYDNDRIRKIDPSGNTITLAGNGVRGFADGSLGEAEFAGPTGVAVDATGTVYVGDYLNDRVRKIVP